MKCGDRGHLANTGQPCGQTISDQRRTSSGAVCAARRNPHDRRQTARGRIYAAERASVSLPLRARKFDVIKLHREINTRTVKEA